MSYRIIRKAYNDGTHEYVVQKNRILGFIPWFWNTDTFYDGSYDITFLAIFKTEIEAKKYLKEKYKRCIRKVVLDNY